MVAYDQCLSGIRTTGSDMDNVGFMGRGMTLRCSTGYNGRSAGEIKGVGVLFLDFVPVGQLLIFGSYQIGACLPWRFMHII